MRIFLSRYIFTRFGFAATTLQEFFNVKLFFKFVNKCGGAVAVSAIIGILGKKALTAEKSLKSFLNSLPLQRKNTGTKVARVFIENYTNKMIKS